MNLNKKISTESEFKELYAKIYHEFQKIANNTPCNALVAYDSIFIITINENSYNEKLYWLIGDFLFACAKERRNRIFSANDWFYAYCTEFKQFCLVLNSINALCVFLNEILVKNGKGRKIDDFGFLLWERCILQQLERVKNVSIGEEMLRRIESNNPYFKYALISLKKIIPNQEEPLYFYRVTYEDSAMKSIRDKYKNKIIYHSFDDLVEQMEKIYIYENERLKMVFLPESIPMTFKILEDILIGDNHSFIYTSLYQCLKTDPCGIKPYFDRMSFFSDSFVHCCKDVIRSFVRSNYINDIREYHQRETDNVAFFSTLYDKICKSAAVIDSCFPGEQICDHIFAEKCNQLKSPTFNERLVMYSSSVMMSHDYETMKIILYHCVRFINDKNNFSLIYFAELHEKLLNYKLNYSRELSFVDFIRSFIEPHYFRKYVKMIKDIELSLLFNEEMQNNTLLVKSEIDKNSTCFVTILNYSAWSIDDKENTRVLTLPIEFESYRTQVDAEYIKKYPERTLIWIWDKGFVEIALETDKEYIFRLNILQYIVLRAVQDSEGISLVNISEVTVLTIDEVDGLLYILAENGLVIHQNNLYFVNYQFRNENTEFLLDNQTHTKKFKKVHSVDLKMHYKAKVIQLLKKNKKLELLEIENSIENDHIPDHKFNKDYFQGVMKDLENNGYIEVNDTTVYYEA